MANNNIKDMLEEVNEDTPVISFEDTAKRIIKKAIRSAICIDDRFIEPYMSLEKIEEINKRLALTSENLVNDIPTQLYSSFRKDGECDLDIYHFENFEDSWHPEYMLNNKDLVVLDWELEGKGNFQSTLKIIKKIIFDDKIPFLIIYTQKPREEFFEIAQNLIFNFNQFSKESQLPAREFFFKEFQENLIKISDNKDWEEDQTELFWEKEEIKKIILDYVLVPTKKGESRELLISEISKEFNISSISSISKKLDTAINKVFENKFIDKLEQLTYLLFDSNSSEKYKIERINVEEIGFRINNCIITFFSKPDGGGVSPDNVFTQFSNLISSSPHNFLTLLSLEMRDRFREDFSKIGNDISQIDERAFFHHLEYYKTRSADTYQNQFYDFLLKSWTNELSEYNLNLKPKIFETIEIYQQKNSLKDIKGVDIIGPLADLAVKLSTTKIQDRLKRDNKIRFGDIFKMTTYNNEDILINDNQYVLSLTPHCVCLDSCKIDNNFYFIRSEDVSENYTSALKKIEIEHYSFINDKIVKAIKWGDCKPFTLFIENNQIENLNSIFMNQKITLEYITTLQENFAQRIANKSFSYGTSIGIDLPHLS